jgi:apolipoprotein D and lipocalin family protein
MLNTVKRLAPVAILAAACNPPETVDYVDLERYDGVWYEIASYEQSYQAGCEDTTATYTIRDDGDIDVLNECDVDGEYNPIEGYAYVTDSTTNAKLRVVFNSGFPGDYWIIDLDDAAEGEDYEWAVVGSSIRSFLWILSREPELDSDTLDGILDRLEAQDYDVSDLKYTVHN